MSEELITLIDEQIDDIYLDAASHNTEKVNELIQFLGGDKTVSNGDNLTTILYYITLLAIRRMAIGDTP